MPTIANSFWWFNMHSSVDVAVTPRPQYRADGRKVPDCWTHPPELRDELQQELGAFPLFHFWGPMSDIRSTDWIARAAMKVEDRCQPALQLVYLPHLDYCLQKFGPEDARIDPEIREIDRVFGALLEFFEKRGVQVVVLSEYGIAPVDHAVMPNRVLREAGFLSLRVEDGRVVAVTPDGPLPLGAKVVDWSAFTVLPGLIDPHVHLRDPGDASVESIPTGTKAAIPNRGEPSERVGTPNSASTSARLPATSRTRSPDLTPSMDNAAAWRCTAL